MKTASDVAGRCARIAGRMALGGARRSMRATLHAVCCAAALFVAMPAGAQQVAGPPPPLPDWRQRPIETPHPSGRAGEVGWVGVKAQRENDSRSPYELVLRRWSPATGATSFVPLGMAGDPGPDTVTREGTLFVLSDGAASRASHAALVTADGRSLRSAALVARYGARWVVLEDQSAVLIGGHEVGQRSLAVERVRRVGDQLLAERLADLPGPPRGGYAAVALADGRLMVLGGNSGEYRGCMPCLAATHILDPLAKAWQDGPAMIQPRAEHSATRLPDGSVLVAGGWTPKENRSEGPTRSSERWRPGAAGFEAGPPMVSGSADHQALWLPDQPAPRLLVAGGMSTAIQAFEPTSGQWRSVGASAQASRNGSCVLLPFVHEGRGWLWRLNRSEPQYGPGDCRVQDAYWVLTSLRLGGGSASGDRDATLQGPGVMLDRQLSAFVPASGDLPALVIGGTAGENARAKSAAVDAIGLDGVALPSAPLHTARQGALAARLAGGVLVLGGQAGADNARPHEAPAPPAEWWPDGGASGASQTSGDRAGAWLELAAAPVAAIALGAGADGVGLMLGQSGRISRVTVRPAADAQMRLDPDGLPPLNRARSNDDGNDHGVRIRGLADGRIVVAGGLVQADKIARLQPDSDRPAGTDSYLGIGPYLPSRRHEIFDPVLRSWRNSAPSRAAGGKVAILDDGRVVKATVILHPASTDKSGREVSPATQEAVLEISSADGSTWRSLSAGLPAKARPERSGGGRPFVVDGELLLSTHGEHGSDAAARMLLWLDTASGQWETLWDAKPGDNWRADVGRHVVRRLANGKRIVVPVAGF